MRRSHTAASQRKTCIAKRSGKCQFKLFLPPLPPCSVFSSCLLFPKGFPIIPFSLRVFFTIYVHVGFLCSLALDACFFPDIASFLSPIIKKNLPLLQLNLPFLFLSFSLHPDQLTLTDWGQSKHWGGAFNFIDPSRGAKVSLDVTRTLPQRDVRVGFKSEYQAPSQGAWENLCSRPEP